MNKEPLDPYPVVRTAIALKGLKEFKDKDLYELVDTACHLLLYTYNRIPNAEQDYMLRSNSREAMESKKAMPLGEVAKLVTGESVKAEALKRFDRFRKFLSEPHELFTEWERTHACTYLNASAGIQKDFCDWLMEVYPRWWKFEQTQLQSQRASKRYPEKVEKSS
jgi:hypothetical protein